MCHIYIDVGNEWISLSIGIKNIILYPIFRYTFPKLSPPLIWTPRLLDFRKISHLPYYLDPPFIKHQRVHYIWRVFIFKDFAEIMQVNNTWYHTKRQGRCIWLIRTDALYNVGFIVIMYKVLIYFEHFVFVFSLLFGGN